MEEKKEKRQEHRKNALTIGIGNPDTAERFLAMKTKTYAATYEEIVQLLLDAYDSSGVGTDNSEELAKLQQRIEELEGKLEEADRFISRNGEIIEGKDLEIADLRAKLDAAVKQANENAESGLGKQLQLDELRQRTDGAIIIKPNPVVAHFLNEMAAKTGSTPDKILEKLFFDDLQNPMSNHLPYVVTSSEIRKVMAKLREPEKPKENE